MSILKELGVLKVYSQYAFSKVCSSLHIISRMTTWKNNCLGKNKNLVEDDQYSGYHPVEKETNRTLGQNSDTDDRIKWRQSSTLWFLSSFQHLKKEPMVVIAIHLGWQITRKYELHKHFLVILNFFIKMKLGHQLHSWQTQ